MRKIVIQMQLVIDKERAGSESVSYTHLESLRHTSLQPFELDRQPVSVAAFRQFTDNSHYKTYAEQVGYGYALTSDGLHLEEVDGGNWRNGMKRHPADDDSPVVGVTFRDAAAYCKANGLRLPSEDEWEYVARGPSRKIFGWGNEDVYKRQASG